MNHAVNIPFDNRYISVADTLYTAQLPTPVKSPGLIRVNSALAEYLGINPNELASDEGIAVLAGNVVAAGSEPIATVYAGHQFGGWNPQLGDGRAILLGEVVARDGLRYDLQLKGAGVTPYSRMGDGRSPLGPVLREYIVSEAMAALGVPTTRALAAVSTGEHVIRDEILPGAILARVARSHIRVGTFQFFAARQDWDSVRKLAGHVIERHYPDVAAAQNPYLALLREVIVRQARLIAQWQSIGFVHGVMNTDNMLVSGETVDYGPCAFMESYHPATVFSSIDHGGRYAYGNQPGIAHWNLAWLAQSLLPLINDDQEQAIAAVQEALDTFMDLFLEAYKSRISAKIGLPDTSDAGNELTGEFLQLMMEHKVDFTLGFRGLSDYLRSNEPEHASVAAIYPLPVAFHPWLDKWRAILGVGESSSELIANIKQRMNSINPILIARNHRVEQAIKAGNTGDFTAFHKLVDLLANPFDFDPTHSDPSHIDFALPARPDEQVTRTFCGT